MTRDDAITLARGLIDARLLAGVQLATLDYGNGCCGFTLAPSGRRYDPRDRVVLVAAPTWPMAITMLRQYPVAAVVRARAVCLGLPIESPLTARLPK